MHGQQNIKKKISFVYNLKHHFNKVINACFSQNQGISGAPYVYK